MRGVSSIRLYEKSNTGIVGIFLPRIFRSLNHQLKRPSGGTNSEIPTADLLNGRNSKLAGGCMCLQED